MDNPSSHVTQPITPSASRLFSRWLEQISLLLFEPFHALQHPVERRKARSVAVFLLAASAALVIRFLVSPTSQAAGNKAWFAVFALVSIGAYFLARTRYYALAAWVVIIDMCMPSYLRALTLPGQSSSTELMVRFSALAFALVLAGLILSNRGVVVVTVLNLAAIVLLAGLHPDITGSAILASVGFVGVLGTLIVIAGYQRNLLENDRSRQDLLRERQLDEVNHAISSALDLPTVLQTVVRTATGLAGGEAGLLSLVAEDGSRLETVLGYNLPDEQVNSRPAKGQGLAWHVIETRKPVLLDQYNTHPDAFARLAHANIRAYLGVPVLAGETCLGALAVASTRPDKRFTHRDRDLLESMARQAGIAIQNARLYASLENELSERRRVEGTLHQREAILEAVASAAGQFLLLQDWQRYIQTVLAELGRITHSSHAYIFQNHPGPQGRMVTSQFYEWSAPDTQQNLGRDEFKNVPLEGPVLERWRQAMLAGEPFYGSTNTWLPGEAQYLAALGAQSVLEMPVYVQHEAANETGEASLEWWGLIGFDDYTGERQWSAAEVDAIKIAATILSAAIQRQRSDQAMREREDIYRRAISTADAVPYYLGYNPFRFIFLGEGVLKLTGYAAAEMTPELWNSRVVQAIPKGDANGLTEPQAVQLARSGNMTDWRCDYLFQRQDGELRWIADTGIELIGSDGHSHGCIGILQDITGRKQVEDAALQANLVLEKRVQERTAALQLANKELEAFAYSVSHDLRAPLRAIDGYSRILLQDYQDRLDADGQVCLENVRLATHKMNQLIDDLLQLSRVTRQEMKTERVNLSSLASGALEARARRDTGRVVQFTVEADLEATGDPNLLRIAIDNLVSNAWKFTRNSAQAIIQVGRLPVDDRQGSVVYFIRDNGVGFDMRHAGKLFQPFQRLPGTEEFEGTGVGLATTQRIIHRHNGRLWAEGTPKAGATFYFTIGSLVEWRHENSPA